MSPTGIAVVAALSGLAFAAGSLLWHAYVRPGAVIALFGGDREAAVDLGALRALRAALAVTVVLLAVATGVAVVVLAPQ